MLWNKDAFSKILTRKLQSKLISHNEMWYTFSTKTCIRETKSVSRGRLHQRYQKS